MDLVASLVSAVSFQVIADSKISERQQYSNAGIFVTVRKNYDICILNSQGYMSIEEVQQAILEEFAIYDDWMDKYGYLIELGNSLPEISASEKSDAHLIKGCQSRVWLLSELRDGKIWFRGESDAVIVKGLVALLLRVVSGRTPQELLNHELHFIDDLGLRQHLSPTRSNGLLAMVKQIRLYAVAYNKVLQKQ